MSRVIDMEMNVPHSFRSPRSDEIDHGRPGTPFSESLPRPAGYGFENYEYVFRSSDRSASPDKNDNLERRTWRGAARITQVRQLFPGHLFELVARFNPGVPTHGPGR